MDPSCSLSSSLTEVSCLEEVRDKKTREGQCAEDAQEISPTQEGDGREQLRGWRWSLSPKLELLALMALCLTVRPGGQGSGPQRVCHRWTRGRPSFAGSGLPVEEKKLARAEQQAVKQPREPPGCFLCSWEPRGPPKTATKSTGVGHSGCSLTLVLSRQTLPVVKGNSPD